MDPAFVLPKRKCSLIKRNGGGKTYRTVDEEGLNLFQSITLESR